MLAKVHRRSALDDYGWLGATDVVDFDRLPCVGEYYASVDDFVEDADGVTYWYRVDLVLHLPRSNAAHKAELWVTGCPRHFVMKAALAVPIAADEGEDAAPPQGQRER